MNRNLDGMYFRVERDGEWQNICFTDLTDKEIEKVSNGRSLEWWRSVALNLRATIKEIGDAFDLARD